MKPIALPFACLLACSLLLLPALSSADDFLPDTPPVSDRAAGVLAKINPRLADELQAKGLTLGSPVFMRIFKLERTLELWVEKSGSYELFRSYPICSYSGYPGPKLMEGDWQSPEGFYRVTSEQMNPWSDNHLAFNIGYPNEYDKAQGRTGGSIMVHGGCTSMGCFAMSDYRIEEIYALAHAALTNGQEAFSLHIFPFRLTSANLNDYQNSPWFSFWQSLKKGYDAFERYRVVPRVMIVDGKYVAKRGMEVASARSSRRIH